jgi:adenosylcobinamide hydrolase
MFGEVTSRQEGDINRDVLVWHLPREMLAASTAHHGGGIGLRRWVLNAEVPSDYRRTDVHQHVLEIVDALKLKGEGIGMLTAARVRRYQQAVEAEVEVEATIGLSHPTWAASNDDSLLDVPQVGTVNIVAFLPVRLEDGALLNALATATEAKSQALWDAHIPATGTASDALSILCPLEGETQRFAGPRSEWGSRLARAVHRAVLAGAREWST